MDDFCALVPFAELPRVECPALMGALCALEPGEPAGVHQRPDGTLDIWAGHARGRISFHAGVMPEQSEIASIGMADLPEVEANRLRRHSAYALLECHPDAGTAMDRMILMIKTGMVLCDNGGWALCVPAGGICVRAAELEEFAALNREGPRVWRLDEAEGQLPGYVPRHLWESLRKEAQPSSLLVGFVPAQVENTTWFFSAGHSLFGLPEIVYSDGTLEDFESIRALFRFLMPYFYLNPGSVRPRKIIRTAGNELAISLHQLPERYNELQASTGTLRLRLMETTEIDSEWE